MISQTAADLECGAMFEPPSASEWLCQDADSDVRALPERDHRWPELDAAAK
ncbi:MAG: hypothetical protein AAF735_03955 [Myxococcota bacterium]